MKIAMAKQGLAMQTTGNTEQDDAHIHDAARSTCMIAAGFCPNGCGELHEVGQHQVCIKCGFSYHQTSI
jgi:Pyruvate/2-oxoacid:ferredoxin oxidoreductase delta subunit